MRASGSWSQASSGTSSSHLGALVQGTGFRVQRSGFRVQGLAFRLGFEQGCSIVPQIVGSVLEGHHYEVRLKNVYKES